jgi:predicted CXXCH cytochrome family protein
MCVSCHPKETARFLASPMGKSVGPPETLSSGRVTHQTSGSVMSVEYRAGRMFHALSERGLTAEYHVAYQIGSGIKGRTYAVQVGDYLLESPLSWYKGSGWDASPGYESMQLLDFDRPITANCLFCHSGKVKFADADGRRLAASRVEAITCERCHGDSEVHARRPSAQNIVNPAKLSGATRDSVCEQCHLEGETRVLNPGKTLDDYHPGDPLERTMVTYLLQEANVEKRAVTQMEELAESQCARASGGKLWCGTCHDPHASTGRGAAVKRATQIAQVCRSCHSGLSKIAHPAAQNECTSCHMPGRPANSIAHLAMTDHRIRRPNAASIPYQGADAIIAWREPPAEFRQRDLALAGLQISSREKLSAIMRQSMKLLEALPEAQQNSDPDVLSSLEVAFLDSSPPDKAVALSRWAVESMPKSATFALNYGLALKRAGDLKQAEREFLRSIDLDPSLMRSYAELAVLYDSEGRQADSMATIDRFLKWNPQTIQFRLARHP